MKKRRCNRCFTEVFEPTMRTWGRIFVCIECYLSLKTGKPVIKYGTAESVTKIAGRAFISEKKVPQKELEKLASEKKPRRKKLTVTSADYRIEDEADLQGE